MGKAGSRLVRSAAMVLLVMAVAGPRVALAAVDVEARLSMGTIEAGGVVSLLVTVTDPRGTVGDPQFTLPAGLDLLGSSRQQQFSWVNGRSTNQVLYRFEIGASRTGRYSVGPIRVTVGGHLFRSGELPLVVTATAAPSVGSRGSSAGRPASLVLSLDPPNPVVGQACMLRVQLIQRVNMAEDSEYDPPATPGFWSERWGDASAYRAKEGRNDVSVTERSLRLYPLAPGPAVVSPARGVVTPATAGLLDPFGGYSSQRIPIVSESLHVSVRPLPPDPPEGFGGGVGDFDAAWRTDRSHTTQDQAILARLELRGVGNLPLIRAPAFDPSEFDVFSSSVEDSLPAPGRAGAGRRTFLWTLLPKRAGHLRLTGPTVSWYDPANGRYVTTTSPTLAVDVLTARGGPAGEDADGLPTVFREHSSRPGGRAAWPLVALLGGLFLSGSMAAWRRSRAPDPAAGDRARQREWLRSIGLARGPDFWTAADQAASWLHARGEQVLRIREAISAARYGGRADQESDVRRWLVERLGASMPPPPARWPLQLAAVGGVVLAAVCAALALPQPGPERFAGRALGADAQARTGEVAAAEAEWSRLWDESGGDPALAARLAWGALQRDDVAAATVWTIRGDRREARDPSLTAIGARVRAAGGLVGAPGRALPFRSWEWAILAFGLGGAAGALWPRRPWGAVALVLACVAGSWWPVEGGWRSNQRLAVVRTSVSLPPTDILLDSGQVVRVQRRAGDQVAVRAASDLEGTLPASALWFPGPR
jgi:hypothetical protein